MNGTTTTNELYSSLSPAVRDELSRLAQEMIVPAGTTLISHTQCPECLIIIEEGSVEISVAGLEKPTRLSVADAGKVLGLRAIVSGELPEIEATTLTECKVRRIPRQAFLEVVQQRPELYLAICKVLSSDLNAAERFLRQTSRTPSKGRDGFPKTV